jgi:ribosomal-protein-alanine N-acetyltransferase
VKSANESVGTVGLTITSKEHRAAEFSIVIGRAYWGKGIGTAATALVKDYAFGSLGLAELHAEVLQRNIASIRLLERAGFQLVRAVAGDSQAGGSEDCFLYVLGNPSQSAG